MFALNIAEGVATLTLSRPPVNAISEEWMRRFDGELDALAARDDWKVLHLRSDQKVFCAGADLREVQSYMQMADGPDRMYAFVANIQRLYARIERIDRVTLAEIGGAAMGGGLELALSCDLRIAAVEAKIALPEARLGLIPAAGGTQRLTRLCGPSPAARLILGAEVLDGAAARNSASCNGPIRGRNWRSARSRSRAGSPNFRSPRSSGARHAWRRRAKPAGAAFPTSWK